MSLPLSFQKVIDEFSLYTDARSRLMALITRGKQLKELDISQHQEQYKVPGCTAVVHIKGTCSEGRMQYQGHADTALIKGVLALLIESLEHNTPEDIVSISLQELEQSGLGQSIVPSRTNGFRSLFVRMQELARSHIHAE